MIIKPRVKGFICTTAHPKGCRENIEEQVSYALSDPRGRSGYAPKTVLVVGASTGYGLSCRITSAFQYNAATIGVFLEREPALKSSGSPGWYNTAYFEEMCREHGKQARSVNGDAFSPETKQSVIEKVRGLDTKIDLVIYSVAAPRRKDPVTGNTYFSKILPVGSAFSEKTVDIQTGLVSEITISPATGEEISDTVKVMGGEDWLAWMGELLRADVLAEGVTTLAFSYIGPEFTHPIYLNGTIGRAKEDLFEKSREIHDLLKGLGGRAFISVNKALVTQASSAIPVVPLYISILYKVMKEKGLHENCIQQSRRLFENLGSEGPDFDSSGRLRLDNFEMQPDVQERVKNIWGQITTENLGDLTDIAGYRQEFMELFGFRPSVDTDEDVDHMVPIPSL